MNLVFIVGTGRCGSSFVHEVLAKHEGVGFISNIEDNFPAINTLGYWNSAVYRSLLGRYTNKGGLRFAPSEAYKLFSKEVSPIYENSFRDLTDQDVTPWLKEKTVSFFKKRNLAQAKKIFLHKYTGWSRVKFFLEIFPNAKFIHIVRDGRAVANSWLQMPWWGGYKGPESWQWGSLNQAYQEEWTTRGRSFPHLAALSWKILMDSFHESEKVLGENNYLKIRYEDVLDKPRESFEEMLCFSGLDWTLKFEKQFEKQIIKTGRSRAFEADLASEDLGNIEDSISEMLLDYKYLISKKT